MKRFAIRFSAALATTALFHAAALAQPTITDNFDTGSAPLWTPYNPLALVGNPATFSFPAGVPSGFTYRFQSTTTVGTFGNARAGSYRAEGVYGNDFYVAVDVPLWNNSLNQTFGVGARIGGPPGLGTTTGYAMTYSTTGGGFGIGRLLNESPTAIGTPAAAVLDPLRQYRFVFFGNGPNLTGQIFDLADLTTPLGTATATDATYTSGFSGLLMASVPAIGSADARFDNYYSSQFAPVPEPGVLALSGIAMVGGWALRRRRKSASAASQPV